MRFTPKSLLCSALGLAGVWLFLVLAFSLHAQQGSSYDYDAKGKPDPIGGTTPGTNIVTPFVPKRVGKACVYVMSDGSYEFGKPPCDYDAPNTPPANQLRYVP